MIGKVAIERRALLNGTIRHDDPIEKELIVAIDTIELKCKNTTGKYNQAQHRV